MFSIVFWRSQRKGSCFPDRERSLDAWLQVSKIKTDGATETPSVFLFVIEHATSVEIDWWSWLPWCLDRSGMGDGFIGLSALGQVAWYGFNWMKYIRLY